MNAYYLIAAALLVLAATGIIHCWWTQDPRFLGWIWLGLTAVILMIVTFIQGCSLMPYIPDLTDPEPGWPRLRIIMRVADSERIRQHCRNGGPALDFVSCTLPAFHEGTCYVYLPANASKKLRDHEEGHCEGRSHVDDPTWAKRVMEAYK